MWITTANLFLFIYLHLDSLTCPHSRFHPFPLFSSSFVVEQMTQNGKRLKPSTWCTMSFLHNHTALTQIMSIRTKSLPEPLLPSPITCQTSATDARNTHQTHQCAKVPRVTSHAQGWAVVGKGWTTQTCTS